MLTRSKILSLLLIVSVGLNLFFIGALTTRLVMRSGIAPMPSSLSWIIRGLDQDTRVDMEPELRAYERSNRSLRAKMFAAQQEVNRQLSAQALNSEATSAAFKELRQASELFQQASHEQTIKVFSELNPADRITAIEFLHQIRGPFNSRAGSRPGSRPGFRRGGRPGFDPTDSAPRPRPGERPDNNQNL